MQRAAGRDLQGRKIAQWLAAPTFRSTRRLRRNPIAESAGEMGLERRIGPIRFLRAISSARLEGNRGSEEARRRDAESQGRRTRARAPNRQTKGIDRSTRSR